MAQNDDEAGAKAFRRIFHASDLRGCNHIPRDSNHKKIAQSLIENELGRNSGIGAANDDGKGLLSGHQIPATLVVRAMVLSQMIGGKASVAVLQAFESLLRCNHELRYRAHRCRLETDPSTLNFLIARPCLTSEFPKMSKPKPPLSRIPAVEKVLNALKKSDFQSRLPQPLVTELVRQEISELREQVRAGTVEPGEFEEIVGEIRQKLAALERSRLQPVINGTGVIIHTNLGRSPLSSAAGDAIREIGTGYSNLELDLDSGDRGKRGGYLERCLALLCQAEAATVSNNCAAALILILKHLANGERNEVVISRGELVEIGGGFRVPAIMETSGAKLREVGATNKTSLEDYEQAIGPQTGMLLKVHRSNFYMEGFVDEPSTEELVELGRKHGIPVVEDLGSGAMIRTDELAPIQREPTAAEVLARGVDLVCVSGDKLFGGPQAGIIAGRADLVAGLKKEPFFRALRCDKLILTGLQAVVTEYLNHPGDSTPDLPLTRMLSAQIETDLKPRAERLLEKLNHDAVAIGEGISRCGGGTMPKAQIPSLTLDLRPANLSLTKLAERLRKGSPPVMGYTAEDGYKIDLRTVHPDQDEALAAAIIAALGN